MYIKCIESKLWELNSNTQINHPLGINNVTKQRSQCHHIIKGQTPFIINTLITPARYLRCGFQNVSQYLVTKILQSQKSVPDPTHNIVTYSLHHRHILMPMVSMYLWKCSHIVSNPQLVKTRTNSRCNVDLILPYLHFKIC